MALMIDNINHKLYEYLMKDISKGSSLYIIASSFSIYAYESLKKELNQIDSLHFLFNQPTFINDDNKFSKQEFYIPKLSREKNLYGFPFEICLKNSLIQGNIAKECAKWVKNKVKFKSNKTFNHIPSGIFVYDDERCIYYNNTDNFSQAGLGFVSDNSFTSIMRQDTDTRKFLEHFNSLWENKELLEDVTNMVLENIENMYSHNSPNFIYYVMLYNIFKEFLESSSGNSTPNISDEFKKSIIWNKLFDFQKEAFTAIYKILEQYNGCILADSVGLGKTFTALSIIKYFELQRKRVLVLCPKKLSNNWLAFRHNYKNNILSEDNFSYDVLCHTDLSRESGFSNGIDLSLVNWANYDLVVIDESHNFRNGGNFTSIKENRYVKLVKNVMRAGARTKVLMLSATPVNNRFLDLKNQLDIAHAGDSAENNRNKYKFNRPLEDIFKSAQGAFNDWSKLESSERTTEALKNMLDNDFFELLDSVTIARSRKHIQKRYNIDDIGHFPERCKPINISSSLSISDKHITFEEINDLLSTLTLSVYTPSFFLTKQAKNKFDNEAGGVNKNLTTYGREIGLVKLMSTNLLKRLESSVYSFYMTISRIIELLESRIELVNAYENKHTQLDIEDKYNINDFDEDDQNIDYIVSNKKTSVRIEDMDYYSWRSSMNADLSVLQKIQQLVSSITAENDAKLQDLHKIIEKKIKKPLNEDNKKIIIFTAFADTAQYLYDNLSSYIKEKYGLNTALVSGSASSLTTASGVKGEFNEILTNFSPISKGRQAGKEENNIDILIATDCISEGQNLQDCDYLINYDIHWNPVRIIQRFGRIDRIGSKNKQIQMVNFWPAMELDKYIDLKSRVENKMSALVVTSTGDDNIIKVEESIDIEFRYKQLERLKNEVFDIEDMSGNVSILDLGLNEFRMDLLEHISDDKTVEKAPHGLYTVLQHNKELKKGVIYILKNKVENINSNGLNRLHPFYLSYITDDGEIYFNHLNVRDLLSLIRYYCKDKDIDDGACTLFDEITNNGKDMSKYSELLTSMIQGIVKTQDSKAVDMIFNNKAVSLFDSKIDGLNDFELICFFAVV